MNMNPENIASSFPCDKDNIKEMIANVTMADSTDNYYKLDSDKLAEVSSHY